MHIAFIELANFRKLKSARIEFAEKQTLFVGANNSGKTSAMTALRLFLKERRGFSTKDVTLSNWSAINALGETWLSLGPDEEPTAQPLIDLLPALDIWFKVTDAELHHVAHLLPSLDWNEENIGVRLQLEPENIEKLVSEFRTARHKAEAQLASYKKKHGDSAKGFELWPRSLHDFFDKRFETISLKAYVLNPDAIVKPKADNVASPQDLPSQAEPLEGDPLSQLIHIREIGAQRGFSDASSYSQRSSDEDSHTSEGGRSRLSDQLRGFYQKHLDPASDPSDEDVNALGAFHRAQKTFDEKLSEGFQDAIGELEQLGYPGLTNPKLTIATRISPSNILNHPSAVQYSLNKYDDNELNPTKLPEDYNGLGFQNLISMVFRLIRFRSDWMRAGKLKQTGVDPELSVIEPLQLVLVEEPEAHLHAQVQQVFIRKAYDVLRNHDDLVDKNTFQTQLIVSTHSSHIAHEVEFECLRYFKRLPAPTKEEVPHSVIANLSTVFGKEKDTDRFVARYLRTTHCDLFFADGAIFIEGAAERMLIPHFIRNWHSKLSEHYVSILEIGGSHAHRLRPLIELLGIPTLVITDLDAVNAKSKKSAQPQLNIGLKTSNPILKSWLPAKEDLDVLLGSNVERTMHGKGYGAIHVTYQRSIDLEFPTGKERKTIIPSTFEDALILANTSSIGKLDNDELNGMVSMTKSLFSIVKKSKAAEELSDELYTRLRKNDVDKAGFALDLLSLPKLEDFSPPQYIGEGLHWLELQMQAAEEKAATAEMKAAE